MCQPKINEEPTSEFSDIRNEQSWISQETFLFPPALGKALPSWGKVFYIKDGTPRSRFDVLPLIIVITFCYHIIKQFALFLVWHLLGKGTRNWEAWRSTGTWEQHSRTILTSPIDTTASGILLLEKNSLLHDASSGTGMLSEIYNQKGTASIST